MTKEKALEVIQKLLSLSQSDQVGEAQSALAKAHQLMAKYNITVHEQQVEEGVVEHECESFGTKSVSKYQHLLMRELSEHYGCRLLRFIYRSGKQRMCLVGYDFNIKACIESFKFAWKVYNHSFDKFIKEFDDLTTENKREFRSSYFAGFVEGMAREIARAEKITALVIVEPTDKIDKLLKGQKIEKMKPCEANVKNMLVATAGYSDAVFAYRNKNQVVTDQSTEGVS